MADSPNSSNSTSPPAKRELSMEIRLLLAFLLMGLVLFLTPYIYQPAPGPKPTSPLPTGRASQVTQKPPEAAVPTPAAANGEPAPGRISATNEQEMVIETELYRVRLSNRGAVVKSWTLKKFKDQNGKPLELVNQAALSKVPGPFAVAMKDDKTASELNYAYYVAKPGPDNLSVNYEYSDGKTVAVKTFTFAKDSYLSQVATNITQNGVALPHLIEWRGGFGDATVLNRQQAQHTVYYNVQKSDLIQKDAKAAKNGEITASGDFSFAGLDDTFFAFVVLPKDNVTTQVVTVKDQLAAPDGKEEPYVGVEIGGDSVNRFSTFVGPKDVDILKRVDPKLQQLIDWGWFWFIAQPLFQTLHYLNDHLVHNYGWSIVVLTVIINLLLLPLRFTSMKSARKMQGLQPEIAAINAKYKNLKMTDPKKTEQNQEVMDLYKKHGVNPLGGCLPMVIQLPFLYGFYKVLAVTIEMRGASWLWVTDLSQPETLPLHILPIVMILTQFIMQKITPNPSMDPSQARMMQFMPLMFGFFFYNMSSGLVLYWLTSNIVNIGQQYIINRYMPAPVVVVSTSKTPQKKISKR